MRESYRYKEYLLECPTGCASTNPTMPVSGKSKDPAVAQSMMLDVSVVFSRCWNPKVGSSVRCAGSQEQELPLPCS